MYVQKFVNEVEIHTNEQFLHKKKRREDALIYDLTIDDLFYNLTVYCIFDTVAEDEKVAIFDDLIGHW